jgi:hypothetical protein
MGLDASEIQTFSEPRLLEKAIMCGIRAPILVTEGSGFPGNTRVAVRFARKYWTHIRPMSIGAIGDADCGSLYAEVEDYLDHYLGTPQIVNIIRPNTEKFPLEEKITLFLSQKVDVTIWTAEIPEDLEKKVSDILKPNYPELERYGDGIETIIKAIPLFGTSEEDVIRASVKLLHGEPWFVSLVDRLRRYIKL